MKFFLLLMLTAIATLLLAGCSTSKKEEKTIVIEEPKQDTSSSLNAYYSSIDYSCKSDSDCEVKNIGNCCGYYPQCTNKKAEANPELVSELCRNEGAASICGFTEISACTCANGRCEPRQ